MLAGAEHVATLFLSAPDSVLWYAPGMPPDAGRASSKAEAFDQVCEHLGVEPTTPTSKGKRHGKRKREREHR